VRGKKDLAVIVRRSLMIHDQCRENEAEHYPNQYFVNKTNHYKTKDITLPVQVPDKTSVHNFV